MINTIITLTPIPIALFTVVVMASVEQIPKNNENTGLSFIKPALKFSSR